MKDTMSEKQKDYLKVCMNSKITQTEDDQKEYSTLDLQSDIYCLTFLKFIESNDPILHK